MNKINKILILSVSTLCIIGTLVLIKALFNDGGKMITDWMSAIANTVMAVAAVYAALQAKRWFSNLSYTTAFNKAAEFLAKIDQEKDEIDDAFSEIYELQDYIFAVNSGTKKTDDSVISDYERLVDYNLAKCNSMKKHLQEYNNLKRWPISRLQSNSIEELIKSKESVYCSITATYDLAKHFLLSYRGGAATNSAIYYNDLKKVLITLHHSKGQYDKLYKEFNNNSFSDYFSAK
ncbi:MULTISPECIES: hypothetical protein [Enterobacteriaceae]|uniref:hypothetical protein n=1 Tax=Enterobacteriaceae TaxID=543 RepID=UPI002003A912|nr:hypothetical protein [Enterobacter roggenkampii]MCK7201127.1 hypothetical protein [Enterobacter roggenkampii]HCM7671653.1 hypothetical protein [Klebsiella quasipneumoniae]